jgi:hypothetical protein
MGQGLLVIIGHFPGDDACITVSRLLTAGFSLAPSLRAVWEGLIAEWLVLSGRNRLGFSPDAMA